MFAPPQTQPPEKTHDHRILLAPGTEPISVRPYRYPHFQKTEIGKVVGELLDSGVIRPHLRPLSLSVELLCPFFFPMLLVKKKAGSWRMCVYYRALNEVTVKDKYPD